MVRTITVLALLLLFMENVAHGKGKLNQPCFLGYAQSGQCIRAEECSKIAELLAKPIFYPQDVQKMEAAARACESDLNSSDAIVCCEPPKLRDPRRRFNLEQQSTTTTTTTTATTTMAHTRRATRTPVPTQRSTTRRVTIATLPTITTSTSTIRYDLLKDKLPTSCGLLPPLNLAFGGVTDEENIHAWAVFLSVQRSGSWGRCVGTLIHERFVLTAAHCVHTAKPENIKLYFGLVSYSELEECLAEGVCQERQAAEIIVHQDYKSYTQSNDVSLIRLVNAVIFTDDVRPACLSLNYLFDENVANGTEVVSVGWGEYEEGRMSDTKRVVRLKVIGKDRCEEQLRKRQRFNMSMIDRVMCTTGVQAGHDVCMGDSGAPMLKYRDKRYHVVGVASFGPRCGTESDKAGVWMRLSEYINWILINLM